MWWKVVEWGHMKMKILFEREEHGTERRMRRGEKGGN